MGKTLGYGEITVANMTEPFTVMLTNEAQQFATDSNRKVTSAQSYYTDIIVIRGSQERTDYTIGNISSGSGITVSKTSKRVTFSVSAGSVIGADTGVIEIPITLDGQTVNKTFSWSCGKQGPQGVKGTDGNSFAWNMLSETNCGKKHWRTASSGGKYSVESEPTEDNIEAVKLICTEPVSSSGWSYTCFTDLEMLKQLKPSTKYTLSYDIKANRSGMISHTICRENITNSCTNTVVVSNIIGDETWQHISVVLTTNDLKTTPTNEVVYLGRTALSKVGYSIIKNLKLTEGYIDTPWSPSQSDIEGKGIVQIVQYYLATSQASGVTSSTSGWSTDITTQKITADKKYLWNCYQTKYSDGTSEPISTPKVIGVYGDKGANALQCKRNWTGTYTTINGTTSAALSDFNRTPVAGDVFTTLDGSSNTGTWQVISVNGSNVNIKLLSYVNSRGEKGDNAKNLSITPSSQYFKSTDGGKTFAPNAITIKPTIQGEINFGKWQYSIDGGVSFADVVSGQKGLTISNNVLTVGKDSSLYSDAVTMVTFRAVASDNGFYDTCSIAKIYDVSDIGDGRNLLWNSNFAKTDEAITGTTNSWGLHTRGTNLVASIDTSTKHNGFNTLKTVSAANGDKNSSNDLEWFAWGISERTSDNLHSKNQNYTLSFYAKASVTTDFIVRWGYDAYGADTTRTLTTNWQKYEIKLHQATSAYSITIIFKLLTAGTVWFSEFKLEKGSSATGYSTAPEDVQTAILSTKSEISDVSLKVDNNKQAIEQRVEKTTYEQDLKLVKGDISKANEGLNKWRYEIYPKSLFADKPEDQSKYDIGVFIRNKNLTPSRTLVFDDNKWTLLDYENNYIGYGLTFIKMSAKKTFSTKWAHSSSCSIYVNGKLIISDEGTVRLDSNNVGRDFSCTFIEGWNCIEFVMQETTGNEWFFFKDAISALSECQLMNCYYGTPVARQSHITNQLVENTTNIEGISGSVQKVMSTVGGSGKIDEFVNNYSTWKKKVNGIETRVGETYTTKSDFNGLEIGGRNLLLNSAFKNDRKSWTDWGAPATRELVTSNNKIWAHIVGNKQNYQGLNQWTESGSIKTGDNITFSARIKGGAANQIFTIGIHWMNSSNTIIDQTWHTFTVGTTDDVYTWTTTASGANCSKLNLMVGVSDTSTAYNVYFTELKLEKGNKATDWTPAPEDNEINGQNLVSNLPANWEQGTVTEGSAIGTTYANTKSASAGSIRPKELIPVSGYITISTAYSNQSQKPIRHWIAAYDVNKNYLGVNYVSNAWNSFPRTLDMKDAKYIAIMVGYTDSSAISPSDISKICLKIERGTSATPFTLAPEDVNGKIQSVETIATQTADKFSWLVKSGTSSSNFELTDKTATLVADKINMDGLVTFNGLDSSARDRINTVTSGNLITVTPANPKSDYGGGQTYNVIADDKGGRCVQWNSSCASFLLLNSYTPVNFTSSDQLYYDIRVPNWSSTTFDTKLTIWFYNKNKALITSASKTLTLKSTIWNHFTGYLTLPSSSNWGDLYYYIIGFTNPNKQAIGFTNDSYIEKVNSYATAYAKNSVDWVGQNGTNTNNMYNMVSKWTDGAVSDTTQMNGGWIKTNTITANKIAIGDFTNYSQLDKSSASIWGFDVTNDSSGMWFIAKSPNRDIFVSKPYPCQGGESYLIEYDISTNLKGSQNSSDTANYIDSAIGVYGYTGDIDNNGLPTKATHIWYAKRVTGSSDAPITHVQSAVTTSDTTKQIRIFLQTNAFYNFNGKIKIRNLSVRKMTTGNLIVDGSITADKIATDAIKSRNYISSGGTQGSFLNLSDGSFKSPNLSWDSNGNLIAKNANLSGQITATKGKIGSFNLDKSLYLSNNSPYYFSQFCAKKVYGLTNEGDIYIGSEGIYSYSWETGNMYIGDSGSIQADVSSSRGVCIENGEIYIYKSDYCKDYPTACDNKYGLVLAGGYVASANYSDGGSIDGFNFILTPNKFNINGKIYASNELQTGGDQIRIISGNIGCMVRNDSADFYILRTNSGDPYGGWTNDRPFRINWASNDITCGHNLTANDLIANSWVYCSEVHSSGAVVIASNSESYYWAHGYQMARGTSWGGVCIGDDSQGLRLYGTSIWASHSISTSDENLKENFTTLDQYEDFYMNLNPIGFNYIGDYDGKKTHFGFGAHKTEDILESEGYDSDKFAVVTHRPLVQEDIEKRFGKDVEVDIETEYGVSYTEFIALNTHMIQKTRKELEQVKQEKTDLEARLQAIEAKLGL